MITFRQRAGRERLNEIVELVGLQERLDELGGNLSHGETQWLEIGMVLTQDPKLLLMDEPTAGMTEQETHRTSEIFNRLKGTRTLVVVEHDMAFVREIADIITLMHLGKTLAEGPMHDGGKRSKGARGLPRRRGHQRCCLSWKVSPPSTARRQSCRT